MSEFFIQFLQADLDNIKRQMDRLESELGKSHKSSLRMAARSILKSAGAITKRSPMYRPYKRLSRSRRRGTQFFEIDMTHAPKALKQTAKSAGLITGSNKARVSADSVADLKKSGFVKIGARGLAKISWQVIGKRGNVGNVNAGARVTQTQRNKTTAAKYVSWRDKFSGSEQYVQMSNNLEYILNAIEGGKTALLNIAGKASRALEKTIENILAKQAAKI